LRRLSVIARSALLLVPARFIAPLIIPTRFVPAGLVPSLIIPPRFVPARITLRRLHLAGRLDAAERAAKFIDLPFIGQLLTLGQFNEFQDLIQLVNRMLERFGDFRCVQNRLVDGRACCRSKISGLHPLPGALLFLTAVRRTVVLRFVLRLLHLTRCFALPLPFPFRGRMRFSAGFGRRGFHRF